MSLALKLTNVLVEFPEKNYNYNNRVLKKKKTTVTS